MPEWDYDLGILGGGSAGLTIAAGAAQLGARTLLIDRDDRLGGDCLHFGCVPSKTLIASARAYHTLKNAKAYGLPETDVRPVDYARIVQRIRSVIEPIQAHDSEERFCGLGVRVVFGNPVFIDEHGLSVDGVPYTARAWAVATGSSPLIPPVRGLNAIPCLTNRDLFSLPNLPTSMIILGGGPIGVEMGQAFSRLGTEVTIVERGSAILPREDKDLSEALMRMLEGERIRFELNAEVTETRDLGFAKEILIGAAGRQKTIRAECVLVAAGRKANLEQLGLEGLGIGFDWRGLKLDERLRTSRKNIYGAGDVTGTYQFTHAAGYEGGIVVSNAIARLPRKADYAWLPWCTFTDPELASIGMNETAARQAGIRASVWTEPFSANDRALAEGDAGGMIKMILDERERPVGVQILGPRAGDLLSEWVAVVNGKTSLMTLASSVHPYPTLGEINKRVAGRFLSTKIFSERVKKGLKLLFSLRGRAC